ncbi:right-handed parallel beta-helix repeat-containing protein [Alistipes sp.]|uniref:right-handed parallel beta-helix repeat-containing protein n=1 Tax=Alistipes sp. TaxID=1872444 RepID=UPI000E94355B|nr:right-handed parallel beta-helix repeat-containing protein [Alistipes sp.]HBX90912.1 alpha-1,3-galactosidase A [Alistipes sp.]
MKKLLPLLLLPLFLPVAALPLAARPLPAQPCDTVRVADFGLRPHTYVNGVEPLRAAISACRERGARVLLFEPGRYDLWPEGAERREWFISNTSSETECPSKVKTVGMLLEKIGDLTVEGNGATLMFHGEMTMLALDGCENIVLRDLNFDFERPGGSEITYVRTAEGETEVRLHRDTRYEVADGRIHLFGEGWRSDRNHCIEYDPESERFFYSQGWSVLAASPAEEIAPGLVRFATPAGFRPKAGNTLTVRDIIRDQVGMFLFRSRNVALENLHVRYMHGLGIVSQYSRDITMRGVRCEPREGSGRLLASSADFMHFSGCSGRVRILGCRFAGAQDDPINVHGTNLRAEERVGERTLRLRFMHAQSYGFDAFFGGDTVAFVRVATMERFASARVEAVRRLSDREVEVDFDRDLPATLAVGRDCVENMSCAPEVEVRGCYFTRTSTRGTLMTTPRRVVIADNTYYKTGMSAILVESDVAGWFESGPVCDLTIENNTFVDCAYAGGPHHAVIGINPSNPEVDPERPVHRNIRIVGNRFRTFGNPVVAAKSTGGLLFERNEIEVVPEPGRCDPLLRFEGCSGVELRGNRVAGAPCGPAVVTSHMKRRHLKGDL